MCGISSMFNGKKPRIYWSKYFYTCLWHVLILYNIFGSIKNSRCRCTFLCACMDFVYKTSAGYTFYLSRFRWWRSIFLIVSNIYAKIFFVTRQQGNCRRKSECRYRVSCLKNFLFFKINTVHRIFYYFLYNNKYISN